MKSPNIETKYKLYKNKLTTIIWAAEKQYYVNKLQEMKNNISRTWKLLNQMTCRNMTNKQITEIESNGTLISNPQMIAEKFNHFFPMSDQTLLKKFPRVTKNPKIS